MAFDFPVHDRPTHPPRHVRPRPARDILAARPPAKVNGVYAGVRVFEAILRSALASMKQAPLCPGSPLVPSDCLKDWQRHAVARPMSNR